MKYIYNDGGRSAAGFTGDAGDCVTRAIAIAAEIPYMAVYEVMSEINSKARKTRRRGNSAGKRSARNGIFTKSKAFKDYMAGISWHWVPTMFIGQGCKVHLRESELPQGRLIVAVSRHYTAVIDGVIHDNQDPQRIQIACEDADKESIDGTRCVYGYWVKADATLSHIQ